MLKKYYFYMTDDPTIPHTSGDFGSPDKAVKFAQDHGYDICAFKEDGEFIVIWESTQQSKLIA